MKRFEKSEIAFRKFLENVSYLDKLKLWKEVREKNLGGITVGEYFSLVFDHIAYNLVSSNGVKVDIVPNPPNLYKISNIEGSQFCVEPFFL